MFEFPCMSQHHHFLHQLHSFFPTSTSSGATATAQATLASAHVGSRPAEEDTEQDRDKFADKALHKEQVILERKNKTKVMTFPWFGLLNCTVKC